MSPVRLRVLLAFLESVALYGLLGWAYVALAAAVHPGDLSDVVARWVPVRKDTFGTVCFVASAVAYLVLDVLGHRPTWRRRAPADDRRDPA